MKLKKSMAVPVLSIGTVLCLILAGYGPIKTASLLNGQGEPSTEFLLGESVILRYSVFYVNVIPRLYSKSYANEMYVTDGNGTTVYSTPTSLVMPTWTFCINDFGDVSWDQTIRDSQGQPFGHAAVGGYMMHTYFGDLSFSILRNIPE